MAVIMEYSDIHDRTIITYWYLLKGDSTTMSMQFMQQQEDGREVLWMTFDAAIKKLSFEGEVHLAERVGLWRRCRRNQEVLEIERAEGKPVRRH